MSRVFFAVGGALALVGVAAGAFASHGLEGRLSADALATFETGVRYQMYHALALLAVAWLVDRGVGGGMVAGWAFTLGTVVFSGSLYVLVLTGQRWMGAVTPLGGVAFLVGWVALAMAFFRA